MKIEVGKYYKSRNGFIHGPMQSSTLWPSVIYICGKTGRSFQSTGHHPDDSDYQLVEEYIPVTNPIFEFEDRSFGMKRAVTMHLFTEANEQLDVSNLDDKDQVMNEGVCIWIYGGCFKLTNKDIKNLISTIKTVNRTVVI